MVGGSKQLDIVIAPDGAVYVETNGVKGKACADLVKFLEEALGEPSDRKYKPEYYEREGHITGDTSTRT